MMDNRIAELITELKGNTLEARLASSEPTVLAAEFQSKQAERDELMSGFLVGFDRQPNT